MMPKRFLIYMGVLLVLLSSSCAKRNTEYQPEEWLTLEHEVPLVGNPVDMDVDDEYIYLAQDQGGISLTRISDYQNQWITRIAANDGSSIVLGRIKKIFMLPELDRLFINEIAATDKITIVNTENPDTLEYKFDFVGGTGGIKQIIAQRLEDNPNFPLSVIYCSASGLKCDYYDGNNLTIGQHTITPPVLPTGFDMSDDYYYLSAEQLGIFIYTRDTQQLVGNLPLPGEAQKVVLRNNMAYIPARQAGLHIVNVSDPSAPVLKGSIDTSGYATEVDVMGTKAVVSSGSGGIYLFDISNPASPELLQHLTSCGYTNSVRFVGNDKIAVASRDQGLLIYKVK